MPTYEYECTRCAHRFDFLQKMSDPPLKSCPKCKAKLRRLINGGAGIIFKGSGFYATDYRKENKKEAAGAGRKACASKEKDCSTCPSRKP